MAQFIRITSESDLPPANQAKEFSCGNKTMCIANLDGKLSAMDNICLHRGGPLGQGVVEGGKVTCPWHGWAWDVKTGATDMDPNLKVRIYPMKIENGEVLVEV